jgi:alkylation response protein AidB-like acyl-CoA dehydrogenase
MTDYELELAVLEGRDSVAIEAFQRYDGACQEARLVCAHWPEEFGGRGLGPLQMAVLAEELAAAKMPFSTRGMGEMLVGPALIAHGTTEQKAYFLPRIIAGQDWYCQGFSEPESGSDLASLRTRAIIRDDQLVISGEKIWTSHAHLSNMVILLVRTNPSAPRHAGISFVLVPLPDNGIGIGELRTMAGDTAFAQLHISEAVAPLFNVVGGLGNGWNVAMTALGSERGSQASTQHLAYASELAELIAEARTRGRLQDPEVVRALVWAHSAVELMRFQGLQILSDLSEGKDVETYAPGTKIAWSEYHRRLGEIAMQILGPDGLIRPQGDGYRISRWQRVFLESRGETIYAGTSQIQRRIIAERILGLPR